MFDIYNIITYDEAPDGLAVIEGEIIYGKNGNPIKWRDLTSFIKTLLSFINRNGDNYTLTREQLITFLHRFTEDYKSELATTSITDFNQNTIIKNNESTYFDVYKNNQDMTDYDFSLAQKEFIKYLSVDDQIKLKNIIVKHFNLHEKKYRLQQDIFDNHILIDNYLFTDLCYCKSLDDEQSIMYEYYSAFDTISSEKEINEIINNDYLNQYPNLKTDIEKQLYKIL